MIGQWLPLETINISLLTLITETKPSTQSWRFVSSQFLEGQIANEQ